MLSSVPLPSARQRFAPRKAPRVLIAKEQLFISEQLFHHGVRGRLLPEKQSERRRVLRLVARDAGDNREHR
ncbi:MAG: hypothetical protein CFK52_12470, partial [Chloracidobacterium sp. CP2_5A]